MNYQLSWAVTLVTALILMALGFAIWRTSGVIRAIFAGLAALFVFACAFNMWQWLKR